MCSPTQQQSANIQYEAFHVFKVFVANPKKNEAVMKILTRNAEKLVAYLRAFHVEEEGTDSWRCTSRRCLTG